MNFNIIDGDQDWMDLIPTFTEMYNDTNIRVSEIKSRMGIGQNTYTKLRRHCKDEGLIHLRTREYKKKVSTPRYWHHTVAKGIEYYKVVKRVNGEIVHFGSFKDARQAERFVELMKECDWDYNRRDALKQQVLNER